MPLKNLPKDWTPIFIALPDINKPPNYMVLKLYIFKPQEIKAPLVGGGSSRTGSRQIFYGLFHVEVSVLRGFSGQWSPNRWA
jgi:hypothetical protein